MLLENRMQKAEQYSYKVYWDCKRHKSVLTSWIYTVAPIWKSNWFKRSLKIFFIWTLQDMVNHSAYYAVSQQRLLQLNAALQDLRLCITQPLKGTTVQYRRFWHTFWWFYTSTGFPQGHKEWSQAIGIVWWFGIAESRESSKNWHIVHHQSYQSHITVDFFFWGGVLKIPFLPENEHKPLKNDGWKLEDDSFPFQKMVPFSVEIFGQKFSGLSGSRCRSGGVVFWGGQKIHVLGNDIY